MKNKSFTKVIFLPITNKTHKNFSYINYFKTQSGRKNVNIRLFIFQQRFFR